MIKNTAGDRLYHQIKHRLNEAYEEIHLSDNHVEGKYCKSVENKLKRKNSAENILNIIFEFHHNQRPI